MGTFGILTFSRSLGVLALGSSFAGSGELQPLMLPSFSSSCCRPFWAISPEIRAIFRVLCGLRGDASCQVAELSDFDDAFALFIARVLMGVTGGLRTLVDLIIFPASFTSDFAAVGFVEGFPADCVSFVSSTTLPHRWLPWPVGVRVAPREAPP